MLTQLITTVLLALATAIPIDLVAHPILPIIPRDDGIVIAEANVGVYICTEEHWGGRCYWEDASPGYCHQYYLGTSSSFGPDHGATCSLYTGSNCDGQSMVGITWPGFSDGLSGTIKSWKCVE
jgi:hypothetical protein